MGCCCVLSVSSLQMASASPLTSSNECGFPVGVAVGAIVLAPVYPPTTRRLLATLISPLLSPTADSAPPSSPSSAAIRSGRSFSAGVAATQYRPAEVIHISVDGLVIVQFVESWATFTHEYYSGHVAVPASALLACRPCDVPVIRRTQFHGAEAAHRLLLLQQLSDEVHRGGKKRCRDDSAVVKVEVLDDCDGKPAGKAPQRETSVELLPFGVQGPFKIPHFRPSPCSCDGDGDGLLHSAELLWLCQVIVRSLDCWETREEAKRHVIVFDTKEDLCAVQRQLDTIAGRELDIIVASSSVGEIATGVTPQLSRGFTKERHAASCSERQSLSLVLRADVRALHDDCETRRGSLSGASSVTWIAASPIGGSDAEMAQRLQEFADVAAGLGVCDAACQRALFLQQQNGVAASSPLGTGGRSSGRLSAGPSSWRSAGTYLPTSDAACVAQSSSPRGKRLSYNIPSPLSVLKRQSASHAKVDVCDAHIVLPCRLQSMVAAALALQEYQQEPIGKIDDIVHNKYNYDSLKRRWEKIAFEDVLPSEGSVSTTGIPEPTPLVSLVNALASDVSTSRGKVLLVRCCALNDGNDLSGTTRDHSCNVARFLDHLNHRSTHLVGACANIQEEERMHHTLLNWKRYGGTCCFTLALAIDDLAAGERRSVLANERLLCDAIAAANVVLLLDRPTHRWAQCWVPRWAVTSLAVPPLVLSVTSELEARFPIAERDLPTVVQHLLYHVQWTTWMPRRCQKMNDDTLDPVLDKELDVLVAHTRSQHEQPTAIPDCLQHLTSTAELLRSVQQMTLFQQRLRSAVDPLPIDARYVRH